MAQEAEEEEEEEEQQHRTISSGAILVKESNKRKGTEKGTEVFVALTRIPLSYPAPVRYASSRTGVYARLISTTPTQEQNQAHTCTLAPPAPCTLQRGRNLKYSRSPPRDPISSRVGSRKPEASSDLKTGNRNEAIEQKKRKTNKKKITTTIEPVCTQFSL